MLNVGRKPLYSTNFSIFFINLEDGRTYIKYILCPNIMDEDELELSEETIKKIQKSRGEYKKGNFYTLDEVKKKLKL